MRTRMAISLVPVVPSLSLSLPLFMCALYITIQYSIFQFSWLIIHFIIVGWSRRTKVESFIKGWSLVNRYNMLNNVQQRYMQIFQSVYTICVFIGIVVVGVVVAVEWEINRSNMHVRSLFFVNLSLPSLVPLTLRSLDLNFGLSKRFGKCIRKLTSTPSTDVW